jgi:uncharacterized protein (DUF433 family)
MIALAPEGATMGTREPTMTPLTRITLDPDVMGGKPCIRGLRVTVGTIVGLVASGRTTAEILAAYPYLEADDIREALVYAAWRVEENRGAARQVIKLVVDVNLSPWGLTCSPTTVGSAVHWSTIGDPRAKDRTVMAWARENGYVVFTHDLDFGMLLALTR